MGTRRRRRQIAKSPGIMTKGHPVPIGAWVTVNAGAVRVIRPIDPFPFLTITVP
jgi:hypothetical protein